MTNYKPGTVAKVTLRDKRTGEERYAYTAWRDGHMGRWVTADKGELHLSGMWDVDVRPLVVLDPADSPLSEMRNLNPGQMRSYANNVEDNGSYGAASVINWLADLIEDQTKPARIPQPGKWGVVADAHGETFVNIGFSVWRSLRDGVGRNWKDIDGPVLVREGVDV